jgi:hypothetical protein
LIKVIRNTQCQCRCLGCFTTTTTTTEVVYNNTNNQKKLN